MKPTIDERGARRRPEGGWEAFTDAVLEAASDRRRGRPRNQSPAQLANLRKSGTPNVGGRPCIATTRAGTPCKRGAARGAERCSKHGGLLEAPAHPSNIRNLAPRIPDMRANVEARTEFYRFPRSTRQAVHQAAHTQGEARRAWTTLLAGAQALHADDTGAAFRRWLKEITAG